MLSNLPKVTIMIPTYGQEDYICDAVESALMQDYENLEVIVSDDCSPDNTSLVLEKFRSDPRFIYSRNENNMGRAGNYHHTLYDLTSGDWVVNLDGDDYYTDSHFITKAIYEITEAELCGKDIAAYFYHYSRPLSEVERIVKKRISEDSALVDGDQYFLKFSRIGAFSHLAILYKKTKSVELGDMYTKPYQASDFHSIMRLIINHDIVVSTRRVGKWREHGHNTTIVQLGTMWEDLMLCYDDIQSYAANFYEKPVLSAWRKEMNRMARWLHAEMYARYHRNLKAAFLLLASRRLNHISPGFCLRWLLGKL